MMYIITFMGLSSMAEQPRQRGSVKGTHSGSEKHVTNTKLKTNLV